MVSGRHEASTGIMGTEEGQCGEGGQGSLHRDADTLVGPQSIAERNLLLERNRGPHRQEAVPEHGAESTLKEGS